MIQESHSTHSPSSRHQEKLLAKGQFLIHVVAEKIWEKKEPERPKLKMKTTCNLKVEMWDLVQAG